MAKRKDIETASPDSAPEQTSPKIETKSELPTVELPSISPATPAPAIEPVAETMPAAEPVAETPATAEPTTATARLFVLRPRHKRYALLAASVAIAAALGAIVGAGASGGFGAKIVPIDVAAVQERQMLEQAVGRLAREVATLRTNLDVVNKSAHSQIARISERVASTEVVTGSISAPQTATPVPTPRPAQPARPQIVQGWAIRDARDGFVYVQSNGDIYQVVPGAPLPGLGAVELVKQLDGRWVVTTPKGIIVSMRDRRYFE